MKFSITILVIIFASTQLMAQTPEQLVKDGQRKFYAGEIELAINLYNKAIELNDEFANAYVVRAFAYSSQDKHEEAVNDYNRILELKPNESQMLVARGSAYNHLKQFKKALVDFDQAIAIDPENSQAYNNRGWAKKGLGDKDGACADWKKSKKLGNGEAKIILINNQC